MSASAPSIPTLSTIDEQKADFETIKSLIRKYHLNCPQLNSLRMEAELDRCYEIARSLKENSKITVVEEPKQVKKRKMK